MTERRLKREDEGRKYGMKGNVPSTCHCIGGSLCPANLVSLTQTGRQPVWVCERRFNIVVGSRSNNGGSTTPSTPPPMQPKRRQHIK